MTDPKDPNSIDALFRATFDQMTDAPASNGWDTPSDRVWQHVESAIQRPAPSGTSSLRWLLLAASIIGIVTAGWYFSNSKQQQAPQNSIETPVTAPAPPAVLPAPANTIPAVKPAVSEQQESAPTKPATQPKNTTGTKPAAASPVNSTPKPPNSTEKQKLQKKD